ncbi:hypothetical protein V6N11_064624 [Hibiscus sabdariffa]|uniref:Uncharacterized protein n=2 Tax=Hibiscus sabdariffa TaxID=183260 RepID=A0ABR2ND97_9ROSI
MDKDLIIKTKLKEEKKFVGQAKKLVAEVEGSKKEDSSCLGGREDELCQGFDTRHGGGGGGGPASYSAGLGVAVGRVMWTGFNFTRPLCEHEIERCKAWKHLFTISHRIN